MPCYNRPKHQRDVFENVINTQLPSSIKANVSHDMSLSMNRGLDRLSSCARSSWHKVQGRCILVARSVRFVRCKASPVWFPFSIFIYRCDFRARLQESLWRNNLHRRPAYKSCWTLKTLHPTTLLIGTVIRITPSLFASSYTSINIHKHDSHITTYIIIKSCHPSNSASKTARRNCGLEEVHLTPGHSHVWRCNWDTRCPVY